MRLRFVPFLAFFLSGASSLIFQTIWTRMLHHVFGATSVAISSVLTVFMAGLGLGAWVFGKYADRIKHPLITYAFAEIGVGICGLIVPLLVQSDGWLAGVNAAMRASLGEHSIYFNLVRFLCVVPLLIVPTTLMGSTLPLLSRHFVEAEQRAGAVSSRVGALYAINTFGAVAGTFLAGFVLMPKIGLALTNVTAVSLNFLLATMILLLRRPLLGDSLKPGDKLQFLPTKASAAETAPPPSEKARSKEEKAAAEEDGPPIPAIARKLAFVAFAASGAASLLYEVVWSRALAMVIGSSIYSFTLILMTFLIGIASGSAATSSFLGKNRRPLVGIAIVGSVLSLLAHTSLGVEHGIGAWLLACALSIALIGAIAAIAQYRSRQARLFAEEAASKGADGASIGSALVAVATVLGIVLAVAVMSASAAWIDAGIAVAGSAGLAAAVNAASRVRRRKLVEQKRAWTESESSGWWTGILVAPVLLALYAAIRVPAPVTRAALVIVIALAMGISLFVSLRRSKVTVWALAMLLVPAASAAVHAALFDGYLPKVGVSVVCAVCLFVGLNLTMRKSYVLLLALTQLFIAGATFISYVWQDEIPLTFARLVTAVDHLPDHVGTIQFFMFLTVALCTLPATLGMGAMFPLTIRIWTVGGGKRIGRDVGVVYTGNTLGSIVGAWLPGFFLMPAIGLEWTLRVGIYLNMALALMMLVATAAETPEDKAAAGASPPEPSKAKGSKEGDKPAKGAKKGEAKETPVGRKGREMPLAQAATVYVLAPLIPALAALIYLGTARVDSPLRWNLAQMTLGVFRVSLAQDVLDPETWGEPDLVYYHDGLTTTVTVERWGRHFALKNNGKVDASNGDDMPTQIVVSAYPLLMHSRGPRNLDVAVIGFGSGVTVGTTLQFPIHSIDVIELERSIPEAAQYFTDVNHLEYKLPEFPYVQMPRLRVINDDGRNYLASTHRRYDVIMSEPSNPWITGVSDLFTTDHFRITKRRLRPGGIYCQWVQLYELSPENIKTIYRTFASQFRHVVVLSAEDWSSDTVLLGSDSPLPLDLAHIRRGFNLPGIPEELERAYLHSPFDVLARVLLSSRDEVLAYTHIEERRRDDEWVADPSSNNAGRCPREICRRLPAPLNTDDNALIEFAAPRDLIGFQRYEGYLMEVYSPDWPYGKLRDQLRGFGTGQTAARNYAELAMALIAHGRKPEAAEFIERSQRAGSVRETAVALEILSLLMSDSQEPRASIEAPVPGPQMTPEMADQLSEGFDAVREAVDRGAYATALAAMEEIPSPLRLHSGPSMRFLYGYLLYKGAEGSSSQYRASIEQLEDLVRSDEEYVQHHPELYYFLARAHDADFNFDKALRNMRIYVETRFSAAPQDALPEPAPESAPSSDEPGEAPKDVHHERS